MVRRDRGARCGTADLGVVFSTHAHECDRSQRSGVSTCNAAGALYRHADVEIPQASRAIARRLLALASCGAFVVGCPRNDADSNGPDDDPPTAAVNGVTLPVTKTAVDALSTSTLVHTELVRITRNFGKSNFEIALDGWTSVDDPRQIVDVRLWWVRPDKGHERSPFSAKSRDQFDIDYEQHADGTWRVDLGSDRHKYRFAIELDDKGMPAAFADVDTSDAGRVAHCKVTRGELAARKVFGAPVGIRDFEVECIDAAGTERAGTMVDIGGD